ncbi:MAG: hypothetical protein ACTSSQ_03650 [Alphaproteobacteria bacterium]
MNFSKQAGLWCLAPALWVMLMPDAASTRPLERHFDADNSCYQRVYSRAHLKKQSTQRVAEIRFDHFPTTFGAYDENDQINFNSKTGEVYFSLSVKFRGSPNRYGSDGTCYPDGKLYRCQVSCDGGSFFLKDRSAKSILLINKTGFTVSGCEVEDFRQLEPKPDDKIFRLDRLKDSACTPPDRSALLDEPVNEPVAVAAAPVTETAASGHGWTSYENGLFGWQIEYPANILKPLPLTDNNAARGFRSADGAAELVAYGGPNDFGDIARYRKFILGLGRHQEVTYDPVGEDWFVLSGYRANRIYYEKYVFSEDREMVHAFALEYPRDQSEFYNKIAAQMSRSFSYHVVSDEADPNAIPAAYQAAKDEGTTDGWDRFIDRYGQFSDDLHVMAAQTARNNAAAAEAVRTTMTKSVATGNDGARTDKHPDVKRRAAVTAPAASQPDTPIKATPPKIVAEPVNTGGLAADWQTFAVNKGSFTSIPGMADIAVRPECTGDLRIWDFYTTHTRGDLWARMKFEVIYPDIPDAGTRNSINPMNFGISFGSDGTARQQYVGKPDIFCSDTVQLKFYELEWFTATGQPLKAQ